MKTLSCPHCGFTKNVPVERIPKGMSRVTCPKCKQMFALDGPQSEKAPATVKPPESVEPPAEKKPAPAAEGTSGRAAQIAITCPHCGVQRKVQRDKIPPRAVKVQCQACKKEFTFRGDRFRDQSTLRPTAVHPTLAARAPESEAEQPRRQHLSAVGELFSRSWQVFKRRILTLIGITLLGVVLAVVVYILIGSGIDLLQRVLGDHPAVIALIGLILAGFTMLVVTAIGAGMTYAIVDEDLGVRESLAMGIQKFVPFLWVFSLVGFIVCGGYFAFFLPGVLFTVWFIFAQFVLARDDVRGMDALLKSRAYVSGHGWGVLGRIFLIALVSGGISIIPFVGALASLFLGPFTLIFYHEIFRDLRAIKPAVSYSASRGDKTRWLLAGAAGYLVLPLVGLLVVGPALWQGLDMLRGGSFSPSPPYESQQPAGSSAPQGRGSLTLGQSEYAPGEAITVHFTASNGLPNDAWIGIIPSHVPHGEESRNDQYDLSYQYLNGRTAGSLQFQAPREAGDFDLRLHDTDNNGVELASVSFRVGGGSSSATVTVSGAHRLDLERTSYAPGESVRLQFSGIASPAAQDWISLYQIGADNQNYGEYYYLGSQPSGELYFTAPDASGQYEFRMFLDWPTGGYNVVARSEVFTVGAAAAPPPATPAPSVKDSGGGSAQSPGKVYASRSGDNPHEVMVYVYSINYLGGVRLNGEEVYPLRGERDMNYNYTGSATLRDGSNLFEIDYQALPDPWMTKLTLRVYRYDWNSGQEAVIGEWTLEDEGGQRSFEVVLRN